MKKNVLFLSLIVLISTTSFSQGFVNLNFESATIVTNHNFGGDTYTAALLGWTPANVPFNSIYLDGSGVNLEGTNNLGPTAIQGKYSVYLQGGSAFIFPNTNGASIAQTAQIPITAQSLTYWGGPLTVTFNNQLLAFNLINNGPGYSVWQADVSALAGQTGELLFAVPWKNSSILDNILFSSAAVPEPASFSLLGLSALVWVWQRRK